MELTDTKKREAVAQSELSAAYNQIEELKSKVL